MKTYQIRVNDNEYTVKIDDPSASPVKVVVDGRAFEVTISQQGSQRDRGDSSVGQPALSDASRLTDHDALLDTYVPVVASTYIAVDEMGSEPTEPGAQTPTDSAYPPDESDARPHSDALEAVTAPMPGTILDIVVEAGDVVQQGDTLCNLEAMKMKSPIRSPMAGTVAQVLISEGQNVGHGDTLFAVRP